MKLKTPKRVRKDLDKIVRQIILIRDEHKCQKCGEYVTGSFAHTSHVIPKGRCGALRWDLDNLKILCFRDHLQWWHLNPVEAGAWFTKKFPKRWEHLDKHKHDIKKWKISELRELLADYENMLEKLK